MEEKIALRQQKRLLNRSDSLNLNLTLTSQQIRPKSVNALEELVQCAICLDKLKDPRMLPCQHTFCLGCLQSNVLTKQLVLNANSDKLLLQCPICQQKVRLENGIDSLKALPTNRYIDSLLVLLERNSPTASPTKVFADPRCVKCQILCDQHRQICQHCLQLFCNICWSDHIVELEEKLKTLLKQLDECEERLNYKIEHLDVRCSHLKEIIAYTTEEKIAKLKEAEKKAVEEVDKLKTERLFTSCILQKQIADMKSSINEKYKNADSSQKVSVFVNLHKETSLITDEVSKWNEARIIFDPETYRIEKNAEAIPNEFEEKTSNSVRVFQNPLENVDTMSAYYKSRTFIEKVIWSKCPRPAGIAIPPWNQNHLYVAATDTQVVLILDRQKMKLIGRLSSEEMLCPQRVAFSEKRKEIYVTDKWKHCIHVFSDVGEHTRTLSTKGSSEGKLRSPDGIIVNLNEELVVCDTGNNRVLILDPSSGYQIKQIGIKDKRTELNVPTTVAISGDSIIIADSGNHRIKVYNMDGEKQQEFGSLGRNPGQFRSAEIVTVDPLGFILVGDAGNARVQVFRPDFSLVRVFGSSKFGWISGMMITPELDIIVTDIRHRRLQIF